MNNISEAVSSVFWGVTVCSSVYVSDFYIPGMDRSHLRDPWDALYRFYLIGLYI